MHNPRNQTRFYHLLNIEIVCVELLTIYNIEIRNDFVLHLRFFVGCSSLILGATGQKVYAQAQCELPRIQMQSHRESKYKITPNNISDWK